MKKEAALVIVKPDGISKGLVGPIISKFILCNLEIVAMRIAMATRKLAEEHYLHIKGTHFFDGAISYFLGDYHKQKKLITIIFYGQDAIKKCRKVAGATNPEEAEPSSIRGSYGRITTKGIYENVVHVSESSEEAEREIKLWFQPDDITVKLYETEIKQIEIKKQRVWI